MPLIHRLTHKIAQVIGRFTHPTLNRTHKTQPRQRRAGLTVTVALLDTSLLLAASGAAFADAVH